MDKLKQQLEAEFKGKEEAIRKEGEAKIQLAAGAQKKAEDRLKEVEGQLHQREAQLGEINKT